MEFFIKLLAKTVTSMYVLQLTLTDSLFLFMLPFFAMYKLTNSWTFGLGRLIFLYATKIKINKNTLVYVITFKMLFIYAL